jgi:hypothetical protein
MSMDSRQSGAGGLTAVTRVLLGQGRAAVLVTLFLVGADLLHWRYFYELNGYFRDLIGEPSQAAVLAVLGVFALYVVSLAFVARLKPMVPLETIDITLEDEETGEKTVVKSTWPSALFLAPSIGFGLLMMMAAVNVSGMGETDQELVTENWQMFATFGSLGILITLVVVGHCGVIKQRYDQKQPQYYVLFVLLVIFSELILNFSYALWMYFFGPDFGAPPIENPDMFWSLVFGTPLFFFFFAAPRFIVMPLNFTWMALASATFVAFYEVWKFLATWPII